MQSWPAEFCRSFPIWGSCMLFAAIATYQLAAVWQPLPLVHAAGWLVVGLVLLPLLFAAGLYLAVTALLLLLLLLAAPWWLRGRPTGLRDLLPDLYRLPNGILPGYLVALRRTRRPWTWGGIAGFLCGIATYAMHHGCRSAL